MAIEPTKTGITEISSPSGVVEFKTNSIVGHSLVAKIIEKLEM
jgi:hypothetical protein